MADVKVVYFVDQNGSLTVPTVVALQQQAFKPLKQQNFGRTSSVYWLKVTLTNETNQTQEKVLEFKETRLNKVEVFKQDGEVERIVGDMYPFINREFDDPNVAVLLSAEATQTDTRFLRITTQSIMNLSYDIWDKTVYEKHILREMLVNMFYFGASIIMFIYNLILFYFIRERAFFYYLIYHLSLMTSLLFYTGAIGQFFFPELSGLRANGVSIGLVTFSTFMATQFLRSFVQTQVSTYRLDRGLLFFMLVNGFCFALNLFDYAHNTNAVITTVTMIVQSLYLLFVSYYIGFVQKKKIAQFYFFGWVLMMLGIVITGLISLGVVPRNELTSYFFQLGSLVEITLLSMGLAYRYKLGQEQLAEKTKVLHEQAKLASMGEMLRHIAHQWRQPLSEINSVAMKIESEHRNNRLDALALDKNIEQIEDITEHMSKTIQDFNGFFKSNKETSDTTLQTVVDKALGLVLGGLVQSDIKIEVIDESKEKVSVVEGELIQVLLVLLNNARDALNASDVSEKWIKVTITRVNEVHTIVVEDSAGGIKNENLAKVFEPYFTTKFESQGVGIGLYMSKMIVEESLGGMLKVENTPNGAKFTIKL